MFYVMNQKIIFKNKPRRNFISVIIPVYKDPEGVKDTLESLKNQSLDKNSFEVIVANDGGDKETEEVCKGYNVKVVTLKPNRGSYAARNQAIKESRGECLAFIDADIKASKGWLKVGMKSLESYDYVGGEVNIDKGKLKTLAHYYEYLTAFDFEKKLKRDNYFGAGNLCIKRDLMVDLGGFDSRLFSGGDREFGVRVFESQKYKMHFEPKFSVTHPPRGEQALIKKTFRVRKGVEDLAKFYPERFSYTKKNLFKKTFTNFLPIYRTVTSKREVSFFLRVKVFFWSILFSFKQLVSVFKNKC